MDLRRKPDILGRTGGEPIPDLGRLPPEQWKAALRPLTVPARRYALAEAPSRPEIDGLVLQAELEFEDWEREANLRESVESGVSIPAPSIPRAARGRQINFRLGPTGAEQLDRAAALLGMKPTTLARALTINGVGRILFENREMRAGAAHEHPATD